MDDWFTIEQIAPDTWRLSEYRHWEETHCYLLLGRDRGLVIDTGLGIGDIREPLEALTDMPLTAVATHVHWDHVGGHRHFPAFYAHTLELPWLQGAYPQPVEAVRAMVADRCRLPEGFDVNAYQLFQGRPRPCWPTGMRLTWGAAPSGSSTLRATPRVTCASTRRTGAGSSPGTWSTGGSCWPSSPPRTRRPTSSPWSGSPPCR